MAREGKTCPNCGHELVDYRTDRTHTGLKEVVLRWLLCPACRHVSLARWLFGETLPAALPR